MALGYTATVIGGFWPQNGVSSLVGLGKTGDIRVAAQIFQASPGMRGLAKALNGVAPGAVASTTQKAVEANVEMGGVRNIITETFINRATTAQDVTDFATIYAYGDLDPAVAVPNLDQNPLGTR